AAADRAGGIRTSRGERIADRLAPKYEGVVPADLHEFAVLAIERLFETIGRLVEADIVAAAIAEPSIGNGVVLDRHRPQQRAVAHVGILLTTDGALRAGRLRPIEIPGARFEAIGLRGQRADRAELRDVAGKVVVVRTAGCRRDDVART